MVPGLHSLTSQWARIRRRAGLEDVPLRELRNSFASFDVGLGLPLQQAKKLCGHSQIATTERYALLADDPIRRRTSAPVITSNR